jgi:hypothetical protein
LQKAKVFESGPLDGEERVEGGNDRVGILLGRAGPDSPAVQGLEEASRDLFTNLGHRVGDCTGNLFDLLLDFISGLKDRKEIPICGRGNFFRQSSTLTFAPLIEISTRE